MSGCGGEDITSQKYLPNQGRQLMICRTQCESSRGDLVERTLLSSIENRFALHRFFKGRGGRAGFAVHNIIMFSFDACDSSASQMLSQKENDTRDFPDLSRRVSRD
jgi:hypothetical protein